MAIHFSGFISILSFYKYANSLKLHICNESSKIFHTYFVIFILLCTYAQEKIGHEEMWLFRWPTLPWLRWLIWLKTGSKMHRKAFGCEYSCSTKYID